MSKRIVPVTCDGCGSDMEAETLRDGDARLVRLACPVCGDVPYRQVQRLKPVTAFLNPGGETLVGYLWAEDAAGAGMPARRKG